VTIEDRALDRHRFARLIRALGFPRIEYGARIVEGESCWRELLATAGRYERRQLVGLLVRPLLDATEGSRERVRRWHDAGAPMLDRAAMREGAYVVGDDLDLVVSALQAVPAPVSWFAVRQVAFVTIGAQAGFSCGPLADGPDGPRRLVVLGPGASVLLVCHELVHAFESSGHGNAVSEQAEGDFAAYAEGAGIAADLDAIADAAELRADAAALGWLDGAR
jgi:hypothetical protein